MPNVVAIIGASADRRKYGNKALRAFRDHGDTVIPIHPRLDEVEGLKAYRSVLDVPGSIDMASVYVPPEVGIGLLGEFERKGIPEVWINPGAESDELIAEARRRKLNVIEACSIVGIGVSPSRY